MTQQEIVDALRAKFRTPAAVMAALGFDEDILREGVGKRLNAPLAAAAKAGLKELLGMDATLMDLMQFIDALKQMNPEVPQQPGAPGAPVPGQPVQAAAPPQGGAPVQAGAPQVKGPPQKGAAVPPEETDEEYDHEDPAKDEEMLTAPNGGPPMGAAHKKACDEDDGMGAPPDAGAGIGTDNYAVQLHDLLAQHCPPEVMTQIGEILAKMAEEAEEGEEEVNEAEATEDEDPWDGDGGPRTGGEKKGHMTGAMDEGTVKTIVAEAQKAERANSRAIIAALREVRPVVGELAMDFDAPGDVYRQGLKMRGVDAAAVDKIRDAESLRLLWNNLPKPSASVPVKPFAMDAAAGDSYRKMFLDAARIGRV